MKTIENNNLLREFLGTKEVHLSIPFTYELGEELPTSEKTATLDNVEYEVRLEIESGIINEVDVSIDYLDFDNDWNLLMQVVDKIDNLEVKKDTFSVDIFRTSCQIFKFGRYNTELITTNSTERIEAVYKACVEFVKWYNNESI